MQESLEQIKLLSKQQSQLDRKLCQRSLYYLCKEVLGYKDMVPHVHGDLCHFLTSGEFGRFRQANLPRSWFKTYVSTIGLSIWLTLPDEEGLFKEVFPWKGPNARGLIASNVIDNAAKMLFKIRQEWMNNERLKSAFPELIPDFNKTRWSDHVAEVKRTNRSTEGTYTAAGVGGSVISQHFDYIIEDDLIYARKDDFSGSELMPSQEDIDNAIGWHKLSFSLFADPNHSCIWNVGTRWAPRDLIYYIRKFETNYSCFEIAVTHDAMWPIVSNEQCVWPERYNKTTLEQIFISQGPRMAETQYLNRPRATEDIVFRAEYIKIEDSIEDFPKGTEYKTIVDLAGWGDTHGTARNCILTGTIDSKHHLWISRIDVGRFNPSEVMSLFRTHSRQFNTKIWIEEIQYQTAIRHFSSLEMERTGEFFTQNRLPHDGRRNAKDLRIMALEPVISNGALHIIPSMRELLEEVEFYPHSKTKDILDCLGYLFKIARPVEEEARPEPSKSPFCMEEMERELKLKSSTSIGFPFQFQLEQSGGSYGRAG